MAAGLGSRYGGFKQVDRVGPGGEMLLEYAMFDARRAGFHRVLFIIRQELVDAFSGLTRTLPADLNVAWVIQDPDALPDGFRRPPERTKPWGTVHALLAACREIAGPFAAINADDFYGRQAYVQAIDAAGGAARDGRATIIGLPLEATLSEHGPVVRGICRVAGDRVADLEEVYDIQQTSDGIRGQSGSGSSRAKSRDRRHLSGRELASMNFWVFPPHVFGMLQERFVDFLRRRGAEVTAELPLPDAVGDLIRQGALEVCAREASGPWFGLTHQSDRPKASAGLRALVDAGQYPAPLWDARMSRDLLR